MLAKVPTECSTGEYCKADLTPGGPTCLQGHCTAKPPPPPPFCGSLECGCDGVVRCAESSKQVGTDVGYGPMHCSIPCDVNQCDGVTEYCSLNPAEGTCKPIPSACSTDHSCACMSSAGVQGTCTDAKGSIVVTLP